MANIPAYQQGMDLEYYHQELNTSLQQNISDNGMVMPSQDDSTISTLSSQAPSGTVWASTDTNKLIVNFGGVLYSLDMTPV